VDGSQPAERALVWAADDAAIAGRPVAHATTSIANDLAPAGQS
jgi:hypothetical protein